jgi:hypothetical protein
MRRIESDDGVTRKGGSMELNELNHEERLALVGLMECVATADLRGSAEEAAEVGEVAAALGEDAYRACLDESEHRFADETALRAFLRTIERQEARELIFSYAFDLAASDAVGSGENAILDWVALEWNIEVHFEEP